MDPNLLIPVSAYEWHIPQKGKMRVPGIIYADESLIRDMDLKVYDQIVNVATLPGIVQASFAMPDAHWGYGFPIGGVAAFDPEQGGVVSAGGVGFDISCGVRTLSTGLHADDITPVKEKLADLLFAQVPAGVGSRGRLHLKPKEMDDMLAGGAQWAVQQGYGTAKDLLRIEEHGCMTGAKPACVSDHAKKRQQDEMGTLGSGNHYLEIQEVVETYHDPLSENLGIHKGDILVSIHCGSRGLGHQIGTEYLKKMVLEASHYGIRLPDRELACAPIHSPLGQDYLGAMRAGMNCALANREIVTHLVRQVFLKVFPQVTLPLLYDVSHNTCKMEEHQVGGRSRRVYVHRKGATRAFGPAHADLPPDLQAIGQPVLIGGTMGTASYLLVGTKDSMGLAFGSACHGAGRRMSRHQATRQWKGQRVIQELAAQGILVKSPSVRGVAEEAPGAYKDVTTVVDAAEHAHLARKAAKMQPLICIKG
jgi:tRNA-splicing ligase RtcB (3'-phosphate/5'-hydroxy nucleic acid ligase)